MKFEIAIKSDGKNIRKKKKSQCPAMSLVQGGNFFERPSGPRWR